MTALLTAQSVRVEYGPLVAVRDVSFELFGGQLLGLIGPNGAGKTTLMRVLAGLHAPTRGEGLVMGHPVRGETEVVRREVAFAPDSPPAYEDISLIAFLRFIGLAYQIDPQETEERIDFWLDRLWLSDKREVKIGALSRGMRQRVTLARTFLPNPHVLLLDEPMTGLDPAGRVQLRGVLASLRDQGCAMIVSSHILSDLEAVASHIAILEHGALVRFGATHTLHDRASGRRAYLLRVVSETDRVVERLAETEGVTDLRIDDGKVRFEYDELEERAADLLASLVSAGVRVASFQPVREGLEEAYLRSGLRQVD
ncbi:MAG: ABC transporter ATP-binding protein [Phycisphaerales bacterium]|nr:ABC transporter ATP-binding protein [Phycisphaerales bacterium]